MLLLPILVTRAQRVIGQIFEDNFCQSIQKHWREGETEDKKEKRTATAKHFVLQANAKNYLPILVWLRT